MRMPLPSFSWANGSDIWNSMLEKDATYSRLKNDKMLERHPHLVDSYRTILFDWISEVSQECRFHRETYHLALDLIDRYLAATSNIVKLQLQLIGTTCLHIAAKFEEIRPPNVNDFAELTDGAVKVQDIIDNEVVILSALNWEITPTTSNSWLNIYMQILLNLDKQTKDHNEDSQNDDPREFILDSFILPTTNGILNSKYKRIASVIDLSLLHIESLRFSNSILAASALYHYTDQMTVKLCTGFDYHELSNCVRWLNPFVDTINEIREPMFLAQSTQMHTHVANGGLLEKVVARMQRDTTPVSHKRKISSVIEDELSAADSILLSATNSTSLLTPPKRELPVKRTRRVY